jgi:hypothetical protein
MYTLHVGDGIHYWGDGIHYWSDGIHYLITHLTHLPHPKVSYQTHRRIGS